jgi:tetraacyldisaccharide 4'-kinase
MDLENYLVEVVTGQRQGLVDKFVLVLLTGLAKVYRVLLYLRKKFYQWGVKKSSSLDATVISVGNITVGGTGKTPIVKRLAQDLTDEGYQVVILSRGYKGELTDGVGVVADGESIIMSAAQAGDEPYMLAQSLESVPVVVGPKRAKTGAYAVQRFDPDFIILDDAFQHWQVERDYDIVAVDATNPFGNGEVIPGGLLREPLSSLQRADTVILTKTDQVSDEQLIEIKTKLDKFNHQLDIITTKHQPTYLRDLTTIEEKKIDLNGQRVIAVSGIGNPHSFETTVEDLGAKVVKKMRYQDHHSYSEDEITRLFTLATVHGVDKIITTEKDAVNIDNSLIEINSVGIDFQALGIELGVLDEIKVWDELLKKVEGIKE